MKTLMAVLLGVALLGSASPASAYLLAVATSFDTSGIADKAGLEAAIETAVDDIVSGAITFSPTLVRVENARVIGDRMYIVVLIADRDGEETLKSLGGEDSKL